MRTGTTAVRHTLKTPEDRVDKFESWRFNPPPPPLLNPVAPPSSPCPMPEAANLLLGDSPPEFDDA